MTELAFRDDRPSEEQLAEYQRAVEEAAEGQEKIGAASKNLKIRLCAQVTLW
jgi:hypothetical protein